VKSPQTLVEVAARRTRAKHQSQVCLWPGDIGRTTLLLALLN
jgi:hypothetical protein